jgi:hypothetical protein
VSTENESNRDFHTVSMAKQMLKGNGRSKYENVKMNQLFFFKGLFWFIRMVPVSCFLPVQENI